MSQPKETIEGATQSNPNRGVILDNLTAAAVARIGHRLSGEQISIIRSRLDDLLPSIRMPTHPAYSNMVQDAITELGEVGGSCKEAISEYISSHYDVHLVAHDKFLEHHLEKLCAAGHLVVDARGRYSITSDMPLRLPKKNFDLAGGSSFVKSLHPCPLKDKDADNFQSESCIVCGLSSYDAIQAAEDEKVRIIESIDTVVPDIVDSKHDAAEIARSLPGSNGISGASFGNTVMGIGSTSQPYTKTNLQGIKGLKRESAEISKLKEKVLAQSKMIMRHDADTVEQSRQLLETQKELQGLKEMVMRMATAGLHPNPYPNRR